MKVSVIDVQPENVEETGFFCLKSIKNPGFRKKRLWFEERYREGLRIKILQHSNGMKAGFIEYVPGEYAWRPVQAKGYMFIHCLYVYATKDKGKGLGKQLLDMCEADARANNLAGLTTMTSTGAWMANNQIFLKNGFEKVSEKGRYELLLRKFNSGYEPPALNNWEAELPKYQGWTLMYSDQCPWNEKSATELRKTAAAYEIDLNLIKVDSPEQAQKMPAGFGVFALIHDGKLLEDHYISAMRFKNILHKELPELEI